MESIQVAARLRPDPEPSIWGLHNHHIYTMHKDSKRPTSGQRTTFAFDHCYSPEDSNVKVYKTQVEDMITGSLSGINATVFLYGQTGSGKTYTMLGKPHDTGILIQSFKSLFDKVEQDMNKTYVLRCSYFEIYNEQIYDLLKSASRLGETLQVSEDSKKEFFIKGIIEQSVSSISEIMEVLQRGEINRHYAQTAMNHNSSRSHAIFRLQVQSITNNFIRNYRREQSQRKLQTMEQAEQQEQFEQTEQNEEQLMQGALVTESVLTFVDLAGSEKVSNHYEDDELETNRRVREGQYINKSLFFLTQVINMKAEDKAHVPFRNSSLTKILRSSLGGNSRTLIILCLNPTKDYLEHSMSTLRFGANAKKIETKAFANIQNHNDDEALKILISDYEKKIHDYEKIRADEKEQFQAQLQQIVQQNTELQGRLTEYNREQFAKVPLTYQKPTWASRFKGDIHVEGAGDIIQVTQRVVKPPKHDCSGRIVLSALKASQNNNNQLINNYTVIKQHYEQLQQQHTQLELKLLMSQQQSQIHYVKYQELLSVSKEMQSKLQFDETQLSDEQLSDTQMFYQNQLIKMQNEQVKRNNVKQISYNYNIEEFEKVELVETTQIQKLEHIELDQVMFDNMEKPKIDESKLSSIGSQLESEESFQLEYPKHNDRLIQNKSAISQDMSLNNDFEFKSALNSFINEMDNQILTHHNHNKSSISSSKKAPVKYKTPDTKLKKQSNSQTSIRGKHNVENSGRQSYNNIPKPKSRMKTQELSMLLNNC